MTEAEIQAYADGVLAGERRAAVEAWLASRPEEAECVAAYRRFQDALRAAYEPVLAEPIPAGLRRALPRRAGPGRLALAAALVAAGICVGGFAGWQLQPVRTGAGLFADRGSQVVRRAAVAHATYAADVRHPVELGADDEAQLVAWLSTRLGMKVWAPNLQAAGMTLVGGRLLPGETRPAAWLLYEARDGRRVTLYWAPDLTQRGSAELQYARRKNVHVFYWLDEECGYAVASADLDEQALRRTAVLAYEQLEK